MLPTLRTGDLVILRHANATTLDRGDIIALKVPLVDQKSYGLPASVVHRIIQVQHTNFGTIYITKGDHNAGPDLFHTQLNAIIGQLRGVVPGAGYPLLFVESRDGKIFLGSLVVIAMLYLLFGVIEDRRLALRSTELTVQAILSETERLERLVTAQPLDAPQPPGMPTPYPSSHGLAPQIPSIPTSSPSRVVNPPNDPPLTAPMSEAPRAFVPQSHAPQAPEGRVTLASVAVGAVASDPSASPSLPAPFVIGADGYVRPEKSSNKSDSSKDKKKSGKDSKKKKKKNKKKSEKGSKKKKKSGDDQGPSTWGGDA
jgi:signal peptidase I